MILEGFLATQVCPYCHSRDVLVTEEFIPHIPTADATKMGRPKKTPGPHYYKPKKDIFLTQSPEDVRKITTKIIKCNNCSKRSAHFKYNEVLRYGSLSGHGYIHYGDGMIYRRNITLFDDNEYCSECGNHNVIGNVHKWFCPLEICPRCNSQLVSCQCWDIPYDENKSWLRLRSFTEGTIRTTNDVMANMVKILGNIRPIVYMPKRYKNSKGYNMAENEPILFKQTFADEYHVDGNKVMKYDVVTKQAEVCVTATTIDSAIIIALYFNKREEIRINQGIKKRKDMVFESKPLALVPAFNATERIGNKLNVLPNNARVVSALGRRNSTTQVEVVTLEDLYKKYPKLKQSEN